MKPKLKRKNYKIAGEILYDDPAGGVAPRFGSGVTNASTTSMPNTINNASSGGMGGMSTGTANAAVAGGTALLNLAAKADSGPHKTAAGQGVATGLKYAGTGAALGSTIGTAVGGPLGTAIGGASGATIGFVAGMAGGTISKYKENRRRRQAEQQDIKDNQNLFAQAQQTTDQTIGTQQSNPVYGMQTAKKGGRIGYFDGNQVRSNIKLPNYAGTPLANISNNTSTSRPIGNKWLEAEKQRDSQNWVNSNHEQNASNETNEIGQNKNLSNYGKITGKGALGEPIIDPVGIIGGGIAAGLVGGVGKSVVSEGLPLGSSALKIAGQYGAKMAEHAVFEVPHLVDEAYQHYFGNETEHNQAIGNSETTQILPKPNQLLPRKKNGGSLYEMGGNVQKKSFNGIVHSHKNGVDKTKASMPEGTFVVDADHLKQAVKHGVIEPQKVSPHQGGVPIMITGGKVAPEGVISPDKVEQLLAMGVDLDKYAPNADTSIYDLAGTRKNVKNGGRLGYVDANVVIDNFADYGQVKKSEGAPLAEVWDHFGGPEGINPELSHKNQMGKMVSQAEAVNPGINATREQLDEKLSKKRSPVKEFSGISNKVNSNSSLPMTDEEKLQAVKYGALGLQSLETAGESLWNLSRQRTPIPKPQRFISTPYTPNVAAMDAAQQAAQDKALATGMYNVRQSGGGAENFNAMHANELENSLNYNAQRTGVTEGARQANTTLENQDRANYANSLYAYGVGEAQAKDAFRAMKGEAFSKGMTEEKSLLAQGVGVYGEAIDDKHDKYANLYSNANAMSPGLGHSSFDSTTYRKNQTAYDNAQRTLNALRSRDQKKYDELKSSIRGMNPVDAATYMETNLA